MVNVEWRAGTKKLKLKMMQAVSFTALDFSPKRTTVHIRLKSKEYGFYVILFAKPAFYFHNSLGNSEKTGALYKSGVPKVELVSQKWPSKRFALAH